MQKQMFNLILLKDCFYMLKKYFNQKPYKDIVEIFAVPETQSGLCFRDNRNFLE